MRVATRRNAVPCRLADDISIHATHAGGDFNKMLTPAEKNNFNPRHPCGWRLQRLAGFGVPLWDFNPRHPCGWRHLTSISKVHLTKFQSTPPMRVATVLGKIKQEKRKISIHATHAGGDDKQCLFCYNIFNFNPRHPCGWRQQRWKSWLTSMSFQSTPPMRVATFTESQRDGRSTISIHATHAGGDD